MFAVLYTLNTIIIFWIYSENVQDYEQDSYIALGDHHSGNVSPVTGFGSTVSLHWTEEVTGQ